MLTAKSVKMQSTAKAIRNEHVKITEKMPPTTPKITVIAIKNNSIVNIIVFLNQFLISLIRAGRSVPADTREGE